MNLETREDFLKFSGLFLLTLLVITLLLAHWAEIPLTTRVLWSPVDFGIGLGAAVGMYFSFSWMTSLRDQAGEALGDSLARCKWYDLAILAILVGIVEEFMFRGFLEQWLAQWNIYAAFLISNIVFGLLHAVSPLYAILAMVLGCVLSLLTWWGGEFNLLRPIVAHAVYDFIGFMVIGAEYRQKSQASDEKASESHS